MEKKSKVFFSFGSYRMELPSCHLETNLLMVGKAAWFLPSHTENKGQTGPRVCSP